MRLFKKRFVIAGERSEDPQSPDNQCTIFRGWRVKPAMTDFLNTQFRGIKHLNHNLSQTQSIQPEPRCVQSWQLAHRLKEDWVR